MGIAWDEIKQNIRIGTVLRRYGYYAPERESYRIPCPLHGGRNLSFSVSERDGLWNCFSKCGKGGSVIDLVAALEKIDIKEAAHKITSDFNLSPAQASVALARATTNKVERWKTLQKESEEVVLPPHTELEEGYRGLRRATIEHWGLARVPEGVLIPLMNANGKVCSWSVRRDDNNPKYTNAIGISKCYPYGLGLNAQDIINEGKCWLVEGQLDACGMWNQGLKNVVALMGSSLSERQAMLLLSLTSRLILCMDGDEAGQIGAAKIWRQWRDVFGITIWTLPDNTDPDEYDFMGEIPFAQREVPSSRITKEV
jgi:DNA primase